MTIGHSRLILAGAVLIACTAFASWPIKPASIVTPTIANTRAVPKQIAGLDLAAFRAPIWVAEPPPPPPPGPAAAPPPPPPPPPLKLQLLAIICEGAEYRAAVYDPDSDRIIILAAGENVGTRTVAQVDKSTLTLRDDAGSHLLTLKEGGGM